MKIGEVARRSGVSVRALRYYEDQGLLYADRTSGGQRDYPESAVDRVKLLQELYGAGLGSKAILTLLPCMITGTATSEMLDRLEVEHDRISERIRGLTAARDRLGEVIGHARQTHTVPA